ncbi:transcription factor [Schizosaccharomyces japonicus yFS275]|uniref:Transcription factor n=1 Tax=Schizosaccharomyces japonicus (strain yFS275 / FY16936) TaxID=402676 RepID=B6JXY1_SCHJY|nr:transcription factor [Schizosaccharomyces japonicus yFS275]EEB06399.1 transcription factor [Schizosaccharomyces japonicus yFS275]
MDQVNPQEEKGKPPPNTRDSGLSSSSRPAQSLLNSYIYDYLVKRDYCAAARIFGQEAQIQTLVRTTNDSRDERGLRQNADVNKGNVGGDSNDESVQAGRNNPSNRHDSQKPPPPVLPIDSSAGFLMEWWNIFWDLCDARSGCGSESAKSYLSYIQRLRSKSRALTNVPRQPYGNGYPSPYPYPTSGVGHVASSMTPAMGPPYMPSQFDASGHQRAPTDAAGTQFSNVPEKQRQHLYKQAMLNNKKRETFPPTAAQIQQLKQMQQQQQAQQQQQQQNVVQGPSHNYAGAIVPQSQASSAQPGGGPGPQQPNAYPQSANAKTESQNAAARNQEGYGKRDASAQMKPNTMNASQIQNANAASYMGMSNSSSRPPTPSSAMSFNHDFSQQAAGNRLMDSAQSQQPAMMQGSEQERQHQIEATNLPADPSKPKQESQSPNIHNSGNGTGAIQDSANKFSLEKGADYKQSVKGQSYLMTNSMGMNNGNDVANSYSGTSVSVNKEDEKGAQASNTPQLSGQQNSQNANNTNVSLNAQRAHQETANPEGSSNSPAASAKESGEKQSVMTETSNSKPEDRNALSNQTNATAQTSGIDTAGTVDSAMSILSQNADFSKGSTAVTQNNNMEATNTSASQQPGVSQNSEQTSFAQFDQTTGEIDAGLMNDFDFDRFLTDNETNGAMGFGFFSMQDGTEPSVH